MIIRPATDDDVPAITDILNALLDTTTYEWREEPHTVDDRTEWLHEQQEEGFPVLVAESDGHVVGWAAYGEFRNSRKWPGYRFTVEHSVHVAESHWGHGVGRALVSALVELGTGEGLRVLVAAVDASNTGSIAFHERLGFVEVARMPGVGDKWGQRLDLVLLQLDLAG